MKTKLVLALLAAAGLAALRLAAAPLAAPAAVHVKPDASSPIIETLLAGAEPFAAVGVTPPAGWLAVVLPGAHEVFIRNSDQLKDLTPKPGASYLLLEKTTETPVATAEKGDIFEPLAVQGKYTKLKLSKPLIGYIPAPAPALVAAPPPPAASVVVTSPPVAVVPPPAPIAVPVPPRDLATPPAPVAVTPPPLRLSAQRLQRPALRLSRRHQAAHERET